MLARHHIDGRTKLAVSQQRTALQAVILLAQGQSHLLSAEAVADAVSDPTSTPGARASPPKQTRTVPNCCGSVLPMLPFAVAPAEWSYLGKAVLAASADRA